MHVSYCFPFCSGTRGRLLSSRRLRYGVPASCHRRRRLVVGRGRCARGADGHGRRRRAGQLRPLCHGAHRAGLTRGGPRPPRRARAREPRQELRALRPPVCLFAWSFAGARPAHSPTHHGSGYVAHAAWTRTCAPANHGVGSSTSVRVWPVGASLVGERLSVGDVPHARRWRASSSKCPVGRGHWARSCAWR